MEKIRMISVLSRLSKSDVVIRLLRMSLKRSSLRARYSMTVEYQKRSASGRWQCLHVSIRPREYEYFTDIRKFCKMSVSLFISCAVDEYMKNMNEYKIMDNYLFLNHMLVVETIQNVTTWKIYWGKPANMEGILPRRI
ncbi:MAG: hypothetical protein JXA20_14750 [Spirochaetes bacterium]|nr:hypothetical protein [Spirochaetota bacterium]